jgi:hypothetical protein
VMQELGLANMDELQDEWQAAQVRCW